MTATETAWATAPLWLLPAAALAGLAAGSYIRHVVGKFNRAVSTGHSLSNKPKKTVPALFELLTATIFVLMAWRFGPSPQLPAYLFFAATSIALAAMDLQHRLLPNATILPAIGITALLLTGAAAAGTQAAGTQWGSLARATLGGLLLFTLYLVLAIISPRGMGMGDVKLAALVGMILAFHSWQALFTGTFLGFLIGALTSILILATRRGALKTSIPFGPSMLAGALAASLWL